MCNRWTLAEALGPCGPHRMRHFVYFVPFAASKRTLGRVPELDRIALVRSPADLVGLVGPRVSYLEPVLRLAC
ncbi:hypothetical protein ABZ918_05585 [Streptomyces viridosporus]|uniref:hypothetical protein n=1 Tax=Streptomyces viridosporus TaxID=67581 RepID=UPI00343ADFCC